MTRPRRADFEQERDFLAACLRWLQKKLPGPENQGERIRKWNELDADTRTTKKSERKNHDRHR